MEEVDGIILHALKSVGCDLDDDVRSLHQFSTEDIVDAVVRCLKVIDNDLDLPHKLPPSMSARFRVGSSLAKAVQDLGYRGELGYQTFLYSNEADIRRVFMFLLEKLPKGPKESTEEPLGASALLQRAIAAEIQRRLVGPWTPPYCKTNGICWRGTPSCWHREGVKGIHGYHACPLTLAHGLHDVTNRLPKEVKGYFSKDLKYVHQQPPSTHQVAASILEVHASQLTAQQEWEAEWNQFGLSSRLKPKEYRERKRQRIEQRINSQLRQSVKDGDTEPTTRNLDQLIGSMSERAVNSQKTKGSRFTHTEKLMFAQDEEKAATQIGVGEGPRIDTEEEQKKKQEEEIQKLRDDLTALSAQLEEVQLDVRKFAASKQQMSEQLSSLEKSNREKKDSQRVKKKTLDLLPDAENNIDKLQVMVDSSAQRLVSLASQWEKHRAPLIDKYRHLKEANQDQVSEAEKKLGEIQELRERMRDLATDARSKEDFYKRLVTEYERMAKDVNRSAYTKRILEIVSNIKKQKQEIDKILLDTKGIQKEINQLTGKLSRTFTVTDELIFKDVKKDETVRKAYRNLAALHENCNTVIQTVEETGVIMREIRDLEDQIEQESKKRVVDNLERITEDYQQMKKENQALISRLKKQAAS